MMLSDIDSTSQTLIFDPQVILGAAVFDLNGLPKDYFTSIDYQDIGWVQTAFQALGLRSLLTSSLQLEIFQYSIVHGTEQCTLITKQAQGYLAVIVTQKVFQEQSDQLIQWIQTLTPEMLTNISHFVKA